MHPAIGSAKAEYLLLLWLHRRMLPTSRSSQPASEDWTARLLSPRTARPYLPMRKKNAKKWDVAPERTTSEFDAAYEKLLDKAWEEVAFALKG